MRHLIHLTAVAAILTAGPRHANAQCSVVPSHPHDNGAAYHQVVAFLTQEIHRNASSDVVAVIRGSMDACRHFIPFACATAATLWAAKVCPGCEWDHKPAIRAMLGKSYTDVPDRQAELYIDVWSNIHYGFVGRYAGFTGAELQAAATLPVAGNTDAVDVLTVQIGIDLYSLFSPASLTEDAVANTVISRLGQMCTDNFHLRYFDTSVSGGDDSGIDEAPNEGLGSAPTVSLSSIFAVGAGVDNASVDLLAARPDGGQQFSAFVNGRHASGFGSAGMKVVTGDFNGDGRRDIGAIGAGVDGHSVDLLVSLGDGTGGFGPIMNWRHADGFGWAGMMPVAGDFNGDGRWDIGAIGAGVDGHRSVGGEPYD